MEVYLGEKALSRSAQAHIVGQRSTCLVFVRPGELRKAEWADIDLDAAEWRYTVTKTSTPHIVPLSRQAVDILRELHPLTGRGRFVFPGARSNGRPMSDNAILAAMRRMGIGKDEMSGHGFRAVARTILDEVLGVRPDYIEHQLVHAVRDPNGRAYNRTAHLPERRKMMQQWADYLDDLADGGRWSLVNSGERANFLLLRRIDVLPIVPKGTASPGAAGLRALRNPEKRRAAYCQ